MGHGKFGTAINCMDGRVQIPVIDWMKNQFILDYIDTITEPGPNKILAENIDSSAIESIRKRINISLRRHGSYIIAIIGHHDCAGNPVEKEQQKKHIRTSVESLKLLYPGVEVIGLWVDENWKVNPVQD